MVITLLELTYNFSVSDINLKERNPVNFLIKFSNLDAADPLQANWSGKGNNESPQPCAETMSVHHLQAQAVDQVFLVCS